jgi:septal ring factor EnvC (AmiA/AmiB activator)
LSVSLGAKDAEAQAFRAQIQQVEGRLPQLEAEKKMAVQTRSFSAAKQFTQEIKILEQQRETLNGQLETVRASLSNMRQELASLREEEDAKQTTRDIVEKEVEVHEVAVLAEQQNDLRALLRRHIRFSRDAPCVIMFDLFSVELEATKKQIVSLCEKHDLEVPAVTENSDSDDGGGGAPPVVEEASPGAAEVELEDAEVLREEIAALENQCDARTAEIKSLEAQVGEAVENDDFDTAEVLDKQLTDGQAALAGLQKRKVEKEAVLARVVERAARGPPTPKEDPPPVELDVSPSKQAQCHRRQYLEEAFVL